MHIKVQYVRQMQASQGVWSAPNVTGYVKNSKQGTWKLDKTSPGAHLISLVRGGPQASWAFGDLPMCS